MTWPTVTNTFVANTKAKASELNTNLTEIRKGVGEYASKSADYPITDIDGLRFIYVTTSTTDRTITLPTVGATDNDGRIITIKKVDSGSGTVIVDGEGAETIDGETTKTLYSQYNSITIQSIGTSWLIVDINTPPDSMIEVNSSTGTGLGTTDTAIRRFTTTKTSNGTAITHATSAANGSTFTINENGVYAISYSDNSSSGTLFGLSLNSSALTTNISSLAVANRITMTSSPANNNQIVSATLRLSVGDVIRAHVFVTGTYITTDSLQFIITQNAKT